MESAAVAQAIEQLERELAGLRARVDEDSSSFSALERQIDNLRGRLESTRDAVRTRERELERKQAELAEAERRERLAAYEGEVDKLRKSREAVVTIGQTYLSAMDRYDGEVARMRKLFVEMRAAFGDDPRVAAVDDALGDEAILCDVWESVLKATESRAERATAVRSGSDGGHQPDLSEELKERTGENRAARILEYFNKD